MANNSLIKLASAIVLCFGTTSCAQRNVSSGTIAYDSSEREIQSDGTIKIHLNDGSSISVPSNTSEEKIQEILSSYKNEESNEIEDSESKDGPNEYAEPTE